MIEIVDQHTNIERATEQGQTISTDRKTNEHRIS